MKSLALKAIYGYSNRAENKETMSQGEAGKLKQVAKGGAVFTFGTMSAYLLKLVIGILVIRYIAVSEYGLISFGYVLANIVAVVGSLGLRNSLPRLIAQKRQERASPESVGEVSGTGLLLMALGTGGLSFAFYGMADVISIWLDKPGLETVLRAFAFLIVPLALLQGLTATFQGRQQARPKALFEDIAVHVARFLLVVMTMAIGLRFQGILAAYVASIWIGFLMFAAYALFWAKKSGVFRVNMNIAMGMLAFSMPLLGVGLVNRLTDWVGTLLLGLYQTAEQVALYMAPSRLQILLLVPMMALGFIYTPIATRLHVSNNHSELKRLYQSGTKWVVVFTLPLALYFVIDAEYIVTLLFGSEYAPSAVVLQIISLGYAVHSIMGPNVATLVSCGRPKYVLYGSMAASGAAITLGYLLIPDYGAVGAAVASATALIVSNVIASTMLYRQTEVHALNAKFVVMVMLLIVCSAGLYYVGIIPSADNHVGHAGLLAGVYVFALMLPLAIGCLDDMDFEMLGSMERRLTGKNVLSDRLRRHSIGTK